MHLRDQLRAHTEELLLEAAAKVFATGGYHGTSMEDIAREAGCGTGTLYGYFKGKSDIFSRLISDLTERFLHGLEESVATSASFQDGLDAYLGHICTTAERERSLLLLLTSVFQGHVAEALPDSETSQQAEQRHVAQVIALMQRGVAEGELADADPSVLALALMGIVHSLLYGWLHGLGDPDIRILMNGSGQLFLHGAASLESIK